MIDGRVYTVIILEPVDGISTVSGVELDFTRKLKAKAAEYAKANYAVAHPEDASEANARVGGADHPGAYRYLEIIFEGSQWENIKKWTMTLEVSVSSDPFALSQTEFEFKRQVFVPHVGLAPYTKFTNLWSEAQTVKKSIELVGAKIEIKKWIKNQLVSQPYDFTPMSIYIAEAAGLFDRSFYQLINISGTNRFQEAWLHANEYLIFSLPKMVRQYEILGFKRIEGQTLGDKIVPMVATRNSFIEGPLTRYANRANGNPLFVRGIWDHQSMMDLLSCPERLAQTFRLTCNGAMSKFSASSACPAGAYFRRSVRLPSR